LNLDPKNDENFHNKNGSHGTFVAETARSIRFGKKNFVTFAIFVSCVLWWIAIFKVSKFQNFRVYISEFHDFNARIFKILDS